MIMPRRRCLCSFLFLVVTDLSLGFVLVNFTDPPEDSLLELASAEPLRTLFFGVGVVEEVDDDSLSRAFLGFFVDDTEGPPLERMT